MGSQVDPVGRKLGSRVDPPARGGDVDHVRETWKSIRGKTDRPDSTRLRVRLPKGHHVRELAKKKPRANRG
jgi:hypothetical protein